MRLPAGRRTLGLAFAALFVLCAAWPILRFVEAALGRVTFPFELEWMEGGIVSHIQIARSGEPVYRAPSMTFTPFIYAPLYYYVSAGASLLVGEGYLAARLVSLLSILGVLVLIGRWVHDETGDAPSGVAAAGVFAATYGVTEYWFDIARADSLFLFLLLAGLLALRKATTVRAAVFSGALLSLACLTKQTGAPLVLGALVWFALGAWRLGLAALGTCGAFALVSVGVLYAQSGRWFWFYLVELPSRHGVDWSQLRQVVQTYLWTPVVPMALSALAVSMGVGAGNRPRSWSFHAVLVAGGAFVGVTGMLHTGGYPNVLMPTYATFAIALGLQASALRRAGAGGALGGTALAALLVVLQVTLLDYDPRARPIRGSNRPATPTADDRAAGLGVIAQMSGLERPIWVTSSAYYSVLAGQRDTVPHTLALVDVLKGGGPEATEVHRMIVDHIQKRRFRTIVLDRAAGFLPGDLTELIRTHYRKTGNLMTGRPSQALWPRSGAWVRPEEIWVAR